jgi:hypothetical protein
LDAPLISVVRGARVEGLNLIWTPTNTIESATYPVNICITILVSIVAYNQQEEPVALAGSESKLAGKVGWAWVR